MVLSNSFVYSIIFGFFIEVAKSACPNPPNIANGNIETTGPYNANDVLTYSCVSGFSMSGSPDQTCQADDTWSGTAPTCTVIDNSDNIIHNVSVPSSTNSTFPEWAIILLCIVVGVVLFLLLALVAAHVCKTLNCCVRHQDDVLMVRPHRNTRIIPIHQAPEKVHDRPQLVSVVEEVIETQVRPAKEVKGWKPHSKPIRTINTSTK